LILHLIFTLLSIIHIYPYFYFYKLCMSCAD